MTCLFMRGEGSDLDHLRLRDAVEQGLGAVAKPHLQQHTRRSLIVRARQSANTLSVSKLLHLDEVGEAVDVAVPAVLPVGPRIDLHHPPTRHPHFLSDPKSSCLLKDWKRYRPRCAPSS